MVNCTNWNQWWSVIIININIFFANLSPKIPQILTFFCDLPEALLKGCRQNLDPLSGSLSFFSEKKKI